MSASKNPLNIKYLANDYRYVSMGVKILGQPAYTYLPLFIYCFRLVSPTMLMIAIFFTILAMLMNKFGYNIRYSWYAIRNLLARRQARLRRYIGYRPNRF